MNLKIFFHIKIKKKSLFLLLKDFSVDIHVFLSMYLCNLKMHLAYKPKLSTTYLCSLVYTVIYLHSKLQ